MSTTRVKILVAASFATMIIALPSAQAQRFEYVSEHQPHRHVKDEWLARKMGICFMRELPGITQGQAYESQSPLHPGYFTKVAAQPTTWATTGGYSSETYNHAANPLHPGYRR
jgi:hypothetical protein